MTNSHFYTQSNKYGEVDAMDLGEGVVTEVAFAMRHVGVEGTFSLGDLKRDDGEEEEVAMATCATPTTSSSSSSPDMHSPSTFLSWAAKALGTFLLTKFLLGDDLDLSLRMSLPPCSSLFSKGQLTIK